MTNGIDNKLKRSLNFWGGFLLAYGALILYVAVSGTMPGTIFFGAVTLALGIVCFAIRKKIVLNIIGWVFGVISLSYAANLAYELMRSNNPFGEEVIDLALTITGIYLCLLVLPNILISLLAFRRAKRPE